MLHFLLFWFIRLVYVSNLRKVGRSVECGTVDLLFTKTKNAGQRNREGQRWCNSYLPAAFAQDWEEAAGGSARESNFIADCLSFPVSNGKLQATDRSGGWGKGAPLRWETDGVDIRVGTYLMPPGGGVICLLQIWREVSAGYISLVFAPAALRVEGGHSHQHWYCGLGRLEIMGLPLQRGRWIHLSYSPPLIFLMIH